MTPQEIKNELDAIASGISPKAYVCLNISTSYSWHRDPPVSVSFYPDGIGMSSERHIIRAAADTFEAALADLREKIVSERTKIHAATIRKLAIAIMTQTADAGECSDAGLRGQGFAQSEIDQHGKAACEEATRIGSGGPFEIVRLSGANSNGGPLIETIAAE